MADDVVDEGIQRPKAPIELRSAEVADLNYDQRIVTVIVAPYEQPTPVMWQNEVWTEQFERSAWDSLKNMRPDRVRANRAHDRRMTCGRAVKFRTNDPRGLIGEVKIAKTPLGEETLELCRDNCLSVSAGFAALPKDQLIDRSAKMRRIRTAFLDHIGFVEDPAYPGAEVLEVRENEIIIPDERMTSRPEIEKWMNDPVLARANELLNRLS
jgi:HK97 family phage prohead protease